MTHAIAINAVVVGLRPSYADAMRAAAHVVFRASTRGWCGGWHPGRACWQLRNRGYRLTVEVWGYG